MTTEHEHRWKPYLQGNGYIQAFCRVCGMERKVILKGWQFNTEFKTMGDSFVIISNLNIATVTQDTLHAAVELFTDHAQSRAIRASAITDADIAEVLTGVRPEGA